MRLRQDWLPVVRKSFRPVYDWFVVVFTSFMATLHGGILGFNFGSEFDFTLFVLAAVALLFYYTGILLSQAKRNWFIGIRTLWALSSDEVWHQTNHLGSRLFKFTAVVGLRLIWRSRFKPLFVERVDVRFELLEDRVPCRHGFDLDQLITAGTEELPELEPPVWVW